MESKDLSSSAHEIAQDILHKLIDKLAGHHEQPVNIMDEKKAETRHVFIKLEQPVTCSLVESLRNLAVCGANAVLPIQIDRQTECIPVPVESALILKNVTDENSACISEGKARHGKDIVQEDMDEVTTQQAGKDFRDAEINCQLNKNKIIHQVVMESVEKKEQEIAHKVAASGDSNTARSVRLDTGQTVKGHERNSNKQYESKSEPKQDHSQESCLTKHGCQTAPSLAESCSKRALSPSHFKDEDVLLSSQLRQAERGNCGEKNVSLQIDKKKDGVHFHSPLTVVHEYTVSSQPWSEGSTQSLSDSSSQEFPLSQANFVTDNGSQTSTDSQYTSCVLNQMLTPDQIEVNNKTMLVNIMIPAGDCISESLNKTVESFETMVDPKGDGQCPEVSLDSGNADLTGLMYGSAPAKLENLGVVVMNDVNCNSVKSKTDVKEVEEKCSGPEMRIGDTCMNSNKVKNMKEEPLKQFEINEKDKSECSDEKLSEVTLALPELRGEMLNCSQDLFGSPENSETSLQEEQEEKKHLDELQIQNCFDFKELDTDITTSKSSFEGPVIHEIENEDVIKEVPAVQSQDRPSQSDIHTSADTCAEQSLSCIKRVLTSPNIYLRSYSKKLKPDDEIKYSQEKKRKLAEEVNCDGRNTKLRKVDTMNKACISQEENKSPKTLKQLASEMIGYLDEDVIWQSDNLRNICDVTQVLQDFESKKEGLTAESNYISACKEENIIGKQKVADTTDVSQNRTVKFMTANEYLSQSSDASGSTGFDVNGNEIIEKLYGSPHSQGELFACVPDCRAQVRGTDSLEVNKQHTDKELPDSERENCGTEYLHGSEIAEKNRTVIEISQEGLEQENVHCSVPGISVVQGVAEVPDDHLVQNVRPLDQDEQVNADEIDDYIEKAIDQLVPSNSADNPEMEGTLYACRDEDKKPKIYAFDANICDKNDGLICSPVSSMAGFLFPYKGCFKWKYSPACDLDSKEVVQELPDEDHVVSIVPLKTCGKPLRLGLSRRQPVKHSLHKQFQRK